MLTMGVAVNKNHKYGAAVLVTLLLTGCGPANVKQAPVTAQPKNIPVRNFTSFSNALSCMDTMMLSHAIPKIRLTSSGIPDSTGAIQTGTRDMMITALSKMSTRSGSLAYVDYDVTQSDVMTLQDLAGQDFNAPDYYIRGAITQLDSGVVDSHVGGGVSLPFADFGMDKSEVASVVSMDMNIGNFSTREIMPGFSSNNSMAVVRTGNSGDAGGRIKKAGLFINIGMNRSEGMHQSVRTLLELSLIEVVGKLTQTPYWECLNIESTNPTFMSQARTWYDQMPTDQRVAYIQRSLAATGLYNGKINKHENAELTSAISTYQQQQDLIANGRISFELYYSLLSSSQNRTLTATSSPLSSETPQTQPEQSSPQPAASSTAQTTTEQASPEREKTAHSHNEQHMTAQEKAPVQASQKPSGIRKLAKDEW